MKLLLRIVFIIGIIFKVTLGYSVANPIADIIANHNDNANNPNKYRSIIDKSTEEQNVAKYYKLNDLFSNPQPNEIVLIRGKLLQNLDNNDLFVFQDSNIVANITVPSNLWANINEKTYILNKNIQFLAKVIINNSNNSVSLQAIKVFHKISDTDNYIITQEDKKVIEQLNIDKEKKLSTRTIADTSEDDEEDDLDSVEDEKNRSSTNLYGINKENQSKAKEPKAIKENSIAPTPAPIIKTELTSDTEQTKTESSLKNSALPEDKPAEDSTRFNEQRQTDESTIEKDEESTIEKEDESKIEEELEPEPQIYNKVPKEEYLKSKELQNEDNNVLSPEELQKLEKYDKNPPSQKNKNNLFSFGK